MNRSISRTAVTLMALGAALLLAGISIAPDVRAWFADPEPVQLIIAVADNTQGSRPVEVVVRVPGQPEWRPILSAELPADAAYFGFYEVGEVHNLPFEILGEDGLAMNVGFRMTENMKPVDQANKIVIDIRDDEVIVSGPALTTGTHRFQR